MTNCQPKAPDIDESKVKRKKERTNGEPCHNQRHLLTKDWHRKKDKGGECACQRCHESIDRCGQHIHSDSLVLCLATQRVASDFSYYRAEEQGFNRDFEFRVPHPVRYQRQSKRLHWSTRRAPRRRPDQYQSTALEDDSVCCFPQLVTHARQRNCLCPEASSLRKW